MNDRFEVKFTDVSAKDGVFSGYASIFGEADQSGDIVQVGAFSRSLAEHKAAGTQPAMLWQHDPDRPIGVWTSVVEDEKGLRVEGRLILATEKGRETAALLEAGALSGLSIGYRTVRADRNASGNRVLMDIDLWEISMVTFPMQKTATVDRKMIEGVTTEREMEQLLRESCGLSQKAATGMVAKMKSITSADRDGRDAVDRMRKVAEQVAG